MNRFLFLAGSINSCLCSACCCWAGQLWRYTFPGCNRRYDPQSRIPTRTTVPFSHVIHAGKLKMDCRYCHTGVDKGAAATIPATSTCINCHSPLDPKTTQPKLAAVHPTSTKLKAVHQSWETDKSIPWKRIHRLPDFVFFNHSAHVNRGVSCVVCHGRIDTMEKVGQAKELSMAWCLECHKNPGPNLRRLSLLPSSIGLSWIKTAMWTKRRRLSKALSWPKKTIFIPN